MGDIDTQAFLNSYLVDGGMLQISVGHPDNARWYATVPHITGVPLDKDVFFSPAMRRREGSTKADCLGTKYLWVDVDDPVYPETTLPPSKVVFSGHGHHLYWELATPLFDVCKIEQLNKILIADVPTADGGCWNVNRLLRVPGTWNQPDPKKGETERAQAVLTHTSGLVYTSDDIEVLGRLDTYARSLIRSGDARQFESRSERDWRIITAMVEAGATDGLITLVFQRQPCGDKYRDETQPGHYLEHTIRQARNGEAEAGGGSADASANDVGAAKLPEVGNRKVSTRRKGANTTPTQFVEKADGYYIVGATSRRVSTFTLQPLILLQGVEENARDALVCDVIADEQVWRNVTISRDAFSSVAAIDKACHSASWQWLGTDHDVRQLLPFLMERLKEVGNPKVAASSVLGLHQVDGEWLYLGHKQCASATAIWSGTDAPMMWLPTGREHAKQQFVEAANVSVCSRAEIDLVGDTLYRLNEIGPMAALIGWHAAAIFKPWLEQQGRRMPILNLTGTMGSGKTTLNKNILMPLFSAQPEAVIYDSGATTYVKLALLSSSNAVPVAFGEFRFTRVEQFIASILLAYDSGNDARGRGDQTTQNYILSAPFTIDGEDVIGDAAARERIVLVRLKKNTVEEGTLAFEVFKDFSKRVPKGFATYFVQSALAMIADGRAAHLLAEAVAEMHETYQDRLPDRVRNNYTVALFGCKVFAAVVDRVAVCADVFRESISEIVNPTTGRSATLVDEFVEALINQRMQVGDANFASEYNAASGVFYFQLSSAHAWWLVQRKRQGASVLQKDALVAQLREATYFIAPRASASGMIMFGVDLAVAHNGGLDVPLRLSTRQYTIDLAPL